MHLIRMSAGIIGILLAGSCVEAATLRPIVTLDAAVVRLEDLFDELGPGGERVLGPAPSPGSRIVVEAAQLKAIARQFGVDWRAASPADRVILDRLGRPIPRDQVLSVLRTALSGVGAGDDLDIDIGGFQSPMVPPGVAIDIAVEQLDWDGGSGRFTAQLALTGESIGLLRPRVSGFAQEMVVVPVATRRINPGAVLQSEDLRLARTRAAAGRAGVAREIADVVGQTARRQLIVGQPIALADLGRTAAIQKGARVTLRLRASGLSLAATGLALEAGAMGEHIRILNTASRAIVEGEIVAPDEVRVLPGAQPLLPPGSRTALANLPNWSTP